eukprot:gb/GECG01005000.1/.p1 GENE.gb/GECG01005000.1/~~gb/GECG01005000.1/.p1  ORF type:complete len:215 (+),score=34.32 gb/GECG01005000.1/:1-645(+)
MQTTMSSGQKYVLYYAPGLCSMAPHIALEATGLPYELERVTMKDGKYTLEDGTDLTEVNPKKKVPALKCPNGKILTEGPVISQYIADQAPEKKLAPENGTFERYQLQEMLNFLTSDVHKFFYPLFFGWDDDAKARTSQVLDKGFAYLESQLKQGHKYLLSDTFTIADAYAYNLLTWTKRAQLDTLEKYSELAKFFERVQQLPAVIEALKQEGLI